MYYEILVTKKITPEDGFIPSELGKSHHLFATDKRSISNMRDLKRVYPLMVAAFPEPMFKVSVSMWETTGHELDMEKVMKNDY